ncbi:unnamed protein product [Microthlaspi erraticum]|uniref:Uncharacterized protein n=1 Tax=Microthlaspi erraticum TaxID=1685480 RepID=A0A6D2ITM0_9BRAS|nr:unnamed protein product [Microthlaspi erraticum]
MENPLNTKKNTLLVSGETDEEAPNEFTPREILRLSVLQPEPITELIQILTGSIIIERPFPPPSTAITKEIYMPSDAQRLLRFAKANTEITESTALPGTYSRENSKENESEYYHIRYIHACEASWRLFNHLSQANIRTVQRLPPHPYNVGSVGVQTTRFTRWIAANMTEPHRLRNATARMFFRWDPALREWTDMWREYPLLSCWYLRHRSTRGSSASVDHLYFV